MKKRLKGPKLHIASTRLSQKVNTKLTDNPWKSIQIDRPFPLPSYVKEALQKLNGAGHLAYIVGGSVRDFLLSQDSKDHDIATSAHPDEICRIFPQSVTVGKAFGVIQVPVDSHLPLLEIASFRQDLEYQDFRHPKKVVFSDALKDAWRRDFTVNALFYDAKTQRILDATGGLEDLKQKVIRAIGDPYQRFKEDALRLLRAVRFQTRLNFKLDPQTARAIQGTVKLINKVSHERIRDELTQLWMGPNPAQALQALSDLGLLPLLIPELEALKGMAQIPSSYRKEDLWSHLLKMVQHLAEKNPVRSEALAWAAVLHESGKPLVSSKNEGENFNGHEIEGASLALSIAQRFKISRDVSDRIYKIVMDHLKFRDVFQMRESTLQRLIREPHFEELLKFYEADAITLDGNLAFYEFCYSKYQELAKNPESYWVRLIDGKDLIALGFRPGPQFSEILRTIEDLALEKKLLTQEEALSYVVKNFLK